MITKNATSLYKERTHQLPAHFFDWRTWRAPMKSPKASLLLTISCLVFGCITEIPKANGQLRIRKNAVDLSDDERQAFVDGVLQMKISGVYDNYVNTHLNTGIRCDTAFDGTLTTIEACAHQSPAFLPWHRQYIWEFETDLLDAARTVGGGTTVLTGLPYWEWSVDNSSILFPWTDDFLGGDGDSGSNNRVTTGPFRSGEWDPVGGTTAGGTSTTYLQRNFQTSAGIFQDLIVTGNLASSSDIIDLVTDFTAPYDVAPWTGNQSPDSGLSFRSDLEMIHNAVHVAIQGHMVSANSPDDPVFFLHHGEIDRIWHRWQAIHGFSNYLPTGATGPTGTNDGDVLQPFGVTISDMFNIMGPSLGYTYAPRLPDDANDVDVVVVIDTSGSMAGSSSTGSATTKMEAARNAANTFVDLIESTENHRVGIVEFNFSASEAHPFVNVPADKSSLMTSINGLSPGGATSIGDGLDMGLGQITGASATTNTPFILLMTDGMENTAPMIDDVSLGTTRVNVLGFGSEASLDGQKLSQLAEEQGGVYARAPDGLALQKLYVASFGDMFMTGTLMDPFFHFSPLASVPNSPFIFNVSNEDEIVLVVGWDRQKALSGLEVVAPSGVTITETTPGVVSSSGPTWAFFKIPLPISGDQQGQWEVIAKRSCGSEFCPNVEDEFFISVLADGGSTLRPANVPSIVYTGDTINPLVKLRNENGVRVEAEISIQLTKPTAGAGNILQQYTLLPGSSQEGDAITPRANTLMQLEEELQRPLIPTETMSVKVFDDTQHEDGVWGPDGVYGNPLKDVTQFPGTYEFHAVARYGDNNELTRETVWSVDVEVGIDPNVTEIQLEEREVLPDGRWRVDVEITPRDRFGNYLGTGRLDAFDVSLTDSGSKLLGRIVDTQTGSYRFTLDWDHVSNLLISQPDRSNPITLIIATAIDGDYDNSGEVEIGDLNLVLFNWDLDGSLLPNDWINQRPTAGTTVRITELNGVLFNWGNSVLASRIPEPNSGIIAILGLLVFGIRYRIR